MDNNKLIKCRKCGGNHLTIKCGKEVILPNIKDVNSPDKKDFHSPDKKDFHSPDKKDFHLPDYKKKNNYKNDIKSHKVKILNLPNDFEYSEICDFAKDWGHVLKINTKNYGNGSIAVIEFKYECEANYFINALDNTAFDHYIIKVTKIED